MSPPKKPAPFAGQTAFEADYRLTEPDVMEGFASAEATHRNIHRLVLSAVLAVCAGMSAATLGSAIAPFGAAVFLIALYLLFRVWVLPLLRRRRLARQIAEKGISYHAAVYETGLQITEGNTRYNLSYQNLWLCEGPRAFAFLSAGQLIVLPKRYFREQLPQVTARLQEKLGQHYITLGKRKWRK